MLHVNDIASAYLNLPIVGPRAEEAWERLMGHTNRVYDAIVQAGVEVIPTAEDPYATAQELFLDLTLRTRIKVYAGESNHPLWTPEENQRFRVVHDVMGHYRAMAGFDWPGELSAYRAHALTIPREDTLAHLALFTELPGQVSVVIATGEFPSQRAAILPQWMRFADISPAAPALSAVAA